MEIGSGEWQSLIVNGARSLGIEIDEAVTVSFSIHASELITWNRKMNLTAITHPPDIAVKHYLDSLAPVAFIPEGARLLDIGSGGGFPGIPLKILKPSLSVLLIDSIRKKVNFLKHVLRKLRLSNIDAIQIRAENLVKAPGFTNSFDVIISRALPEITPFVKSALSLLAKNGRIIAMKGEVDQKELQAVRAVAPEDRYALEIKKYRLPSIESQRSIVMLKHL